MLFTGFYIILKVVSELRCLDVSAVLQLVQRCPELPMSTVPLQTVVSRATTILTCHVLRIPARMRGSSSKMSRELQRWTRGATDGTRVREHMPIEFATTTTTSTCVKRARSLSCYWKSKQFFVNEKLRQIVTLQIEAKKQRVYRRRQSSSFLPMKFYAYTQT